MRTGLQEECLDVRGKKQWEVGEDYVTRNFVTCTLHQVIIRVVRTRRMRWACHGRDQKCLQNFGPKT